MTGHELDEQVLASSGLAEFKRNIKLGKFERSYDVAKKTVSILNNIVKDNANSWPTARHLIDTLKAVCAYIDSLALIETAAGNMGRRVMRIVRDECLSYSLAKQQALANKEGQLEGQLEEQLNRDDGFNDDTHLDVPLNDSNKDLLENILEAIEQELTNELDLSSRSIAQQAVDYVQSDDIILTLGKSRIIESFLRQAAAGSSQKMAGKKMAQKFHVIVVELAPFYSGRQLAKSLNKVGISTLIIPDSAVFAIMSRVNKVIIGCHSMMANGGIKAPAGSHSIALAAKHFSVPLIVCCPMYKLTPEYLVAHDSAAFRHFSHIHEAFPEPHAATPSTVGETNDREAGAGDDDDGDDDDGDDDDDGSFEDASNEPTQAQPPSPRLPQPQCPPQPEESRLLAYIESLHSTFDYVPPELITLFVSNIGGNSPSYVYHLLNELYCKSDYLKNG